MTVYVFTIQFSQFRLQYECCKRYTVGTKLNPSLLFHKALDLIQIHKITLLKDQTY